MINIEPVEVDGKYFVNLTMDSQPMRPHGPFESTDEAEAVAYRLAGICRGAFHQKVAIGGRLLTPAVPPNRRRAMGE